MSLPDGRSPPILSGMRGQKRQALKPNEIAAQIGAPRSSVYELVSLLLRNGILEFTGGKGRLYLGRKLYFLGPPANTISTSPTCFAVPVMDEGVTRPRRSASSRRAMTGLPTATATSPA